MTTITRTLPSVTTTGTTQTGGTPPTTETTPPPAGTGASVVKDGFETAPAGRTTETPQQKWQAAVKGYEDKLTSMFVPTAESLAEGKQPIRTSEQVTPEMREQLQKDTKDLFLSMPVGLLAPNAKEYLTSKGLKVGELENTPLKDLGKVGGDVAKQLAEKVKDGSPAVYYGVAAAGAVAVGAVGYTKGSAALEKLGIKPEFKTDLFNDQVNVRAKAKWDAKLANPDVTVGADGRFKLGDSATLNVGGNVNVAGPSFGNLGVKSGDAHLGVDVAIDKRTNVSANGKATFGEGAKLTTGEVSFNGTHTLSNDRGSLSGNSTFRLGESGRLDGVDLSGNADLKLSGDRNLNMSSKVGFNARGEIVNGATDMKLSLPHSSLGIGTDLGTNGQITGHRLSSTYDNGQLSATGAANFSAEGNLVSATLQGGRKWGDTAAINGQATFGAGGLHSAGLNGHYTRDNFRLSGEVEHNFVTSTTTGALSAGYRATKDLDIAVKGAMNTAGESRIGVGLTWRF